MIMLDMFASIFAPFILNNACLKVRFLAETEVLCLKLPSLFLSFLSVRLRIYYLH